MNRRLLSSRKVTKRILPLAELKESLMQQKRELSGLKKGRERRKRRKRRSRRKRKMMNKVVPVQFFLSIKHSTPCIQLTVKSELEM